MGDREEFTQIEQQYCTDITVKFQESPLCMAFLRAVDPERDGIPDYHKVIKNPMDLGTLYNKLEEGVYKKSAEWKSDLMRIWDNAMLFNGPETPVTLVAQKLKAKAAKLTHTIPKTEKDMWNMSVRRSAGSFQKKLAHFRPGHGSRALMKAPGRQKH